MTKKVLISLNGLFGILSLGCSDDCCIEEHRVEDWFNSQPPAPQWVRVEDGLPENDNLVYVSIMETRRDTDSADFGCSVDYSWGLVKIGRYYNKEKNWGIVDYSQQGDFLEVTHWMPIPPLPGVQDDN